MKMLASIATIVALTCSASAIAQCDKSSTITTAETIYLDSANNVVRTVDEICTIEISKTQLIIRPGNNKIIKGPVSDYQCKWATPFKDGKTIMKASVSNEGGESGGLTLTIEGKNGIITCLATIDNEPNKKIKLVATKFE